MPGGRTMAELIRITDDTRPDKIEMLVNEVLARSRDERAVVG